MELMTEHNIHGFIVICLLVFMLAIQIQIFGLSTKIQETIKKVDRLLAVKKRHEEAMTELYVMHRDGKGAPQKDKEDTKDVIWHG